jgi:hypothetical protein
MTTQSLTVWRPKTNGSRKTAMAERVRLPNRRAHELLDFEAMNLKFVASVSRFPSGEIAEIFIGEKARCGSTIGTLCKDLTFSLAVQSGADPEVIRRALSRDAHGDASSPLGKLLDLLATRR